MTFPQAFAVVSMCAYWCLITAAALSTPGAFSAQMGGLALLFGLHAGIAWVLLWAIKTYGG